MIRSKGLLLAAMIAAIAQPICATVPPVQPRESSATLPEKSTLLPLSQMPGLPMRQYTLEEISRRWPAFRHAPYRASGFNAVSLPFRYADREAKGDHNEALAFAFLLSNAMDWAPDNYCTRHAYSIFKRNKADMMPLQEKYDPHVIAALVEKNNGTHAIGGELTKTRDGYCGSLEIYDRSGRSVLSEAYEQPRDFFVLLGDMAADSMRFFGYSPSAALVKHLQFKRCKPPSLIELGKAAFGPDDELEILDRVVQNDPEFVEARYWRANQVQWQDGNINRYLQEESETVNLYLIPPVLKDLAAHQAPEPAGPCSEYYRWLNEVERLLGKNSPLQIRMELETATEKDTELLDRATAVAAKYPNDFWLVCLLADNFMGHQDPAMAASLYLAALQSPFAPGFSSRRHALGRLESCLGVMAHFDEAVQISRMLLKEDLRIGQQQDIAMDYLGLAISYDDAGWHQKALEAYACARQTGGLAKDMQGMVMVFNGIAAALAGRTDLLDEIIANYGEELKAHNRLFLLQACRQALQGSPPDADCLAVLSTTNEWEERLPEQIIFANLDLMAEEQTRRRDLTQTLAETFDCRPMWFLFDLYDRRDPRPESASFYEAISWLHGDDPWVMQAKADFDRRQQCPLVLSAHDLLERLADYPATRWPLPNRDRQQQALDVARKLPPGSVATAIRRCLDKGEFDTAMELALRHHALAIDTKYNSLRQHANVLIHLVEQARERKAKSSQPATAVAP